MYEIFNIKQNWTFTFRNELSWRIQVQSERVSVLLNGRPPKHIKCTSNQNHRGGQTILVKNWIYTANKGYRFDFVCSWIFESLNESILAACRFRFLRTFTYFLLQHSSIAVRRGDLRTSSQTRPASFQAFYRSYRVSGRVSKRQGTRFTLEERKENIMRKDNSSKNGAEIKRKAERKEKKERERYRGCETGDR